MTRVFPQVPGPRLIFLPRKGPSAIPRTGASLLQVLNSFRVEEDQMSVPE